MKNDPTPKKSYLKSEVAAACSISNGSFKNDLKRLEQRIIERYPGYERRSQILHPVVISLILDYYGYNWEEFNLNVSKRN